MHASSPLHIWEIHVSFFHINISVYFSEYIVQFRSNLFIEGKKNVQNLPFKKRKIKSLNISYRYRWVSSHFLPLKKPKNKQHWLLFVVGRDMPADWFAKGPRIGWPEVLVNLRQSRQFVCNYWISKTGRRVAKAGKPVILQTINSVFWNLQRYPPENRR